MTKRESLFADPESRKLLTKALVAAGLVGVGALSGGALPALAGTLLPMLEGVGGEWLGGLTEAGFDRYVNKWSTEDGALNHDLNEGLQQSFYDAVKYVAIEWRNTPAFAALKRQDKRIAKQTITTLNTLRKETRDLFKDPDGWGDEFNKRQKELIAMVQQHKPNQAPPTLPNDFLDTTLGVYLKNCPMECQTFVKERLMDSWLLRFREVLKDNTQARTAYENLWQTSISEALAPIQSIQKQTEQTGKDVEALLLMVDELKQELQRRPEDQLPPGLVSPAALVKALDTEVLPLLRSMAADIKEIKQNTQKITQSLDSIHKAMQGNLDPATLAAYRQKELDLAAALLATLPTAIIPAPAVLPQASRKIPYAHNETFVGREADLTTLAATLKPSATTMAIAAATGMGGIGKTQLASEFAHRYGQFFAGGVYWLSFADPASIPAEIAACAPPQVAATLDLPQQVAFVQQEWQSPIPRLLVFDNCEDETLLHQWRPKTGGCRILVTSRLAHWEDSSVQKHPLDTLARGESIALLRQFLPDLPPDDAALDALAQELGDLPPALHLAGSYLKEYTNEIPPTKLLTQLQQPDLLSHRALQGEHIKQSYTNHDLNIGRSFALSYDQLQADDEIDVLAQTLLVRMAYFAPGEPVPRDLLQQSIQRTAPGGATDTPSKTAPARRGIGGFFAKLFGKKPQPTTQEQVDHEAQAENDLLNQAKALKRLKSLGLLEAEADDALRLHRLLAMFVQQMATDDTVQAAVEQTIQETARRLNNAGDPRPLLALQSHLRHITDAAYQREDERAASLCNELGYHLQAVADYAAARPYLERALDIRERVLGAEHPDTASSLNILGALLYTMGEIAAARPYLERALDIRERVLGAEHPDTASSLNNMGLLLYAMGMLAAARPYYERALDISERVLGAEHPATASSLNNLGYLLKAMGELAAARPYYERALDISERVLGAEHPATASSLNNLGALLKAMGELAAARPYYQRALAILEKALGANHPNTKVVRGNLAAIEEKL